MKNVNCTIGNRSRDLPVCSAVPQPMRHRVQLIVQFQMYLIISLFVTMTSYEIGHMDKQESKIKVARS
jgi:hypothetical protein